MLSAVYNGFIYFYLRYPSIGMSYFAAVLCMSGRNKADKHDIIIWPSGNNSSASHLQREKTLFC